MISLRRILIAACARKQEEPLAYSLYPAARMCGELLSSGPLPIHLKVRLRRRMCGGGFAPPGTVLFKFLNARLSLALSKQAPPDKIYLDAPQTYLPVRMNSVRTFTVLGSSGNRAGQSAARRRTGRPTSAARQGAVPMEIYLDDWRTVDGIQYLFRISQSGGYGSLSFTITEIRHNIPVDASLFELPVK